MESSGLRKDTARPHGTREGFDLTMGTSEAQSVRAGIQRGMGISPAPGPHYRTIENTLTQELFTIDCWAGHPRIVTTLEAMSLKTGLRPLTLQAGLLPNGPHLAVPIPKGPTALQYCSTKGDPP